MKLSKSCIYTILIILVLTIGAVRAQTTEFTYQGRLNDGAMAATGSYDFQFVLYDALSDGTVVVSQVVSDVIVTSGVFTVQLNFGAAFPGAARWLEILVKPSSDPRGHTQL